MADSSSEHIIRLIVQGLNRLGNVGDQVAKETEKMTGAQDKHTKSVKDNDKALVTLRKEYAEFVKEIKAGKKDYDQAREGLARFAGEFDRLSRRQKIGSVIAEDINRSAVAARNLIAQLKTAHETERKLGEQAAKDRIKREDERQRLTQQTIASEVKAEQQGVRARQSFLSDILGEVERDHNERKRFAKELADFEVKEAIRVEETRARSRASRPTQRLTQQQPGIIQRVRSFFGGGDDGGVRRFTVEAAAAGTTSQDTEHKVDRFGKTLERLSGSANRAGFSVAKVDNNLRGLAVVGVIAFAQQAISALVSLGATLFSVASAAAQAGAAIGGAMAAAAAQSVPAIGILVAAFSRITAVFKAVSLFNKENARSTRDQTSTADAQAAAADRVASAQEGVVSATQRVTDATLALTQARVDAIRNIQDLNLAERSASSGKFQAETALRRAIGAGQVGSLEALTIARDQAGLTASRATTDAGQARAQGVEGSDQVRQAVRTLADANTALAHANREMAAANRAATKAATQTSAADNALRDALGQLDKAELALFEAVKRIQARFKTLFRPITDIIVRAFTDAVDRVQLVMGDPRILGPLRQIAEAIATSIRRITRELTSDRFIKFFQTMGREAARNIPLLTTIAIRVGRIFTAIATAGSPALRRFLRFLEDLVIKGDRATNSKSGIHRLQEFFLRGEKMAESFSKLTIAVIRLFAALAGSAAPTGQSAVDQLTTQLNKATDWVNANQGKVRKFFSDALDASKAIAGAVFQVGKALALVFDSKSVQDFAKAFQDILLPAITDVVIALGAFTRIFIKIIDLPVIREFARFAIATLLIHKAFNVFFKLLGPFSDRLVLLLGRIPLVGAAVRGFAIAMRFAVAIMSGPWGIAIAAVVAGIVLLDRKFHFLRPVIKFLEKTFKDFFENIRVIAAYVAPIVGHFLTEVIGGAFTFLKKIVIGFADAYLGMISSVLGGISTLASAASRLPGIGGKFKGLADFIDGARDKIDGYRESLRKMNDEHEKTPGKITRLQTEVNTLRSRLVTLTKGSNDYRETAIKLRHRQDDLNVAMVEAEQKGKQGARGPRALGRSATSAADAVDKANKAIAHGYNQLAQQLGGIKKITYTASGITIKGGTSSVTADTGDITAGRAMGGWMGGQSGGPQGPDNIHVLAGKGEAFLNVGQQGPVEEGLALRQMLMGGPGSLTQLFRQFGGAFAAGGRVGGIDLHGAKAYLTKYAASAMRYGLSVNSGLRPGAITSSGNPSLHGTGDAIDLVGTARDMLRFARHAFSSWGKQLRELIHTPLGFGVKNGKRVPLSFWGQTVNADHVGHVHLGGGAGGVGGLGGLLDTLARQRIHGPAGAIRSLAQRAVDRIHRAANARLGAAGGTGGSGDIPTRGAAPANAGQIRRWIAAGLRLAQQRVTPSAVATLLGRIMQESGGDPNIVNRWDINAKRGDPSKGILQTIGSTFRRYMVRGHGNIYNPVDNIAAAVRYMLATYHRLVGAGPGGYQTGGFVGRGTRGRSYTAPAIFNSSFQGILTELGRALATVSAIKTRGPRFIKRFGRSFDQIFGDGGLLDQGSAAVAHAVDAMALKLKQSTFAVTRSGVVVRRLTPEQSNIAQLASIDRQRSGLQSLRGVAADSLRDVDRRLKLLQRGGVTAAERKTYETLVSARRALVGKIFDLDTAIADAVEVRFNAQEQIIQDAIDKIDQAASQKLARADLADRVANVVESLGSGQTQNAFALRGAALQARSSAIISQRDQLSKAASIAGLLGRQDIVQTLVARIEDLNVTLFENAAAIRSNTVAARQAKIDAITSRGSFLTGVTGGLSNILQAIGAQTGTLDVGRLKAIGKETQDVLIQTGNDLRQQLGETFGVNLIGQFGSDLVNSLRTFDLAGISSNLSVEQRAQFESLINAIIDNASAVEQNTQQLQDLNASQQVQSFTTSAWQLFRTAIFNGMGGLLPQFSVPLMASGGSIVSDGLLYGHQGERIVPAGVKRDQSWQGGDTNIINVTSPTQVADPGYFADVLSFRRSLSRAVK